MRMGSAQSKSQHDRHKIEIFNSFGIVDITPGLAPALSRKEDTSKRFMEQNNLNYNGSIQIMHV